MEQNKIKQLIAKALKAREFSYVPYSHFAVGAALLTKEGDVYSGCNIENAAYGPTNCAERTAFFKAVSEGVKEFAAIAIVGSLQGEEVSGYAAPCGVCRQVMAEFCGPDFDIIVARTTEDYYMKSLKEMLPESFGPANLA
ncbi:cytidine deaminase [Kineothrix sp. MB12-C1]|uniref:cytidine deaminase n=1 Tax=Kineothrix sp. MB12-C1 TaxID=3070215 RepID=UPI0027D27C17|nr:cytidine deaminase [Kineothrix sp. MB12-C1]WMC94557.1 cytidine deaminase [Kineothrix sp. MB12-C1]